MAWLRVGGPLIFVQERLEVGGGLGGGGRSLDPGWAATLWAGPVPPRGPLGHPYPVRRLGWRPLLALPPCKQSGDSAET